MSLPDARCTLKGRSCLQVHARESRRSVVPPFYPGVDRSVITMPSLGQGVAQLVLVHRSTRSANRAVSL